MRGNYNATIRACFGGYMVQAVINTFVPLLFLTLRREYGLSLEEISLLITVNFLVQLTVDLLAEKAVQMLCQQMQGDPVTDRVQTVPPKLVIRNSVRDLLQVPGKDQL